MFLHPEPTLTAITTSSKATTTSSTVVTIISAKHHKQCDVDINAQSSDARQLTESLNDVVLDGNNSTCTRCFESERKQLQVIFNIPSQIHPLRVVLVGLKLSCQEPFTLLYTNLSVAGVKKQQCALRGEKVVDGVAGRVECRFLCFIGMCLGQKFQLATLFESHTWKVGNNPNAELCEVFFTLKDKGTPW